jgi:hypothetical protein
MAMPQPSEDLYWQFLDLAREREALDRLDSAVICQF